MSLFRPSRDLSSLRFRLPVLLMLYGSAVAIVLYVVANDDAVALYQSIGFVQTGMVLTDLRTAPRVELTLGRE